jgi:hypothetical protein
MRGKQDIQPRSKCVVIAAFTVQPGRALTYGFVKARPNSSSSRVEFMITDRFLPAENLCSMLILGLDFRLFLRFSRGNFLPGRRTPGLPGRARENNISIGSPMRYSKR